MFPKKNGTTTWNANIPPSATWLREQLLDEPDDKDMKSLAWEVLRKAADEYGAGDDMTVLAVRVEARA